MCIQYCWRWKTDAVSVGQRGTVQKLVEMEKTPTASKGIMQALPHSGKPHDHKSHKQLQSDDNTISVCAESCTPLSII